MDADRAEAGTLHGDKGEIGTADIKESDDGGVEEFSDGMASEQHAAVEAEREPWGSPPAVLSTLAASFSDLFATSWVPFFRVG